MDTKKKHTIKKEKTISGTGRVCPVCKGTGLDKNVHHRYTTGGYDDRSCPRCNGECYIDKQDDETSINYGT